MRYLMVIVAVAAGLKGGVGAFHDHDPAGFVFLAAGVALFVLALRLKRLR